MKKISSLFVALAFCLSVTACGGSSGRADEALTGKYIAVTGTTMGMTLSGDDVAGFTIELKSGGKATLSVEGDSADGKWVNDDSTLTLTVEKVDMVGQLGEDTITFENFMQEMIGTSMELKFAKEGTDAAKPENFLPEEEKALLGKWTGISVTDALDADASAEISPDALKATLNADHTASVSLNGEEIAAPKWSFYSDMVSFDGDVADGASLYGEVKDGVFTITYSGDDYYSFTMGNGTEAADAGTEASAGAESGAEQALAAGEPSSTGDGYAPREDVLRLIKWIDDDYADGLTYEEVRDFIGVDGYDCGNSGPNNMTALGDHYFNWYADETHYIHVCFRGREDSGRFECCQWNTSGFDSSEWKDISLADWLVANTSTDTENITMEMKEFFDGGIVKVSADVPKGKWYCEENGSKAYFYNVPDKDSQNSGSPRIETEVDKTVEGFDFYKDNFENLEEIGSRTIGGIEMSGRRYKYVGMDWTEYVGKLDDNFAISVKISDVDISDGTEGDGILNSMQFSW